jgi:hypothetical protein
MPVELARGRHMRSANVLLAGAVFILSTSLSIATLHRYGVSYDEPEHWTFGDRYLEFYLTLDVKSLDFSSVGWSPVQTWPVGPTLAALTAKLFSERLGLVDRNDGHHLASIFLFGLLLSSLFLFLAVHAGRDIALLSCLALALQPRIWGEAHNNAQDIPHLVFFSLTILSLLHGLITQRARWLLVSGICGGLALGSKINALSLPVVAAPVLAPLLWDPSRHPASIRRSLVAAPVIALSVLFLLWPYFWTSPWDRVMRFWSYLVRWGYAGPEGWQGSPVVNVLITTPLPILVLGLVGIIASAWTGRPLGRRAILVLLLWLIVPIARTTLPGALNYDVIRRFMEFSPALAIFAGIGGAFIIGWITRNSSRFLRVPAWVTGIAMTAVFLSPAVAVWQYFPYESTYFNLLVGGLGGAQSRGLEHSTDHLLSSYREGITWINAHADPGSVLITRHPHVTRYYRLRNGLALSEHIWMDELPANGRAVYFIYVARQPPNYNICLAEAFLRPEYEVRRDGGVLLRIYKLTADDHLTVARNAIPAPREFSVTSRERWVTLSWQPTFAGDIVGHILYYGRAPGQYQDAACFREKTNRVQVFAGVPEGVYYLSLSVLTRGAQESERTPDLRRELL